jgi:hypothetical protein
LVEQVCEKKELSNT